MNKQELQQAIIADPNSLSEETKALIKQSPEHQKLLQETQQLDADIKRSLEVPVPDTLSSSLLGISKEHSDDNVTSFPVKKRYIATWALAASVLFAVGLSFTVFSPSYSELNGSELAMAHFEHENPYSLELNDDLALDDVNAKLATFNTQMSDKLGRITYANYCFFGNKKSVHMVMETVFGKVTMFVTAKDNELKIDKSFGNELYEGRSWSLEDVDITVINKRGLATEEDFSSLLNYIRYSA